MNTKRPKITPILSTIFQQLALVLLLITSANGVLTGCTNPLQKQPELKENSSEGKSVNQQQQNKYDDDDDDDKKEKSKGKGSDDD
ncbi:hypothetical protein ACE1CI_23810 [Aerosakkonemataceae cyanobacterium BLCC-F50]|uniref:Lipoprotein n=1 Tax=Floridaenema flaviceps BLCC-F50 TaxID=3153642 RepID=A0ABV4XW42_9CYAN